MLVKNSYQSSSNSNGYGRESPDEKPQMPINPIFNPDGDDKTENRSIWFGNTTNLMQLNDVRYQWAVGLYQQMRENFWIS